MSACRRALLRRGPALGSVAGTEFCVLVVDATALAPTQTKTGHTVNNIQEAQLLL